MDKHKGQYCFENPECSDLENPMTAVGLPNRLDGRGCALGGVPPISLLIAGGVLMLASPVAAMPVHDTSTLAGSIRAQVVTAAALTASTYLLAQGKIRCCVPDTAALRCSAARLLVRFGSPLVGTFMGLSSVVWVMLQTKSGGRPGMFWP